MTQLAIIPTHKEPKHYLLKCHFGSGGCVSFPYLLTTNVHLHKLANTDLKAFVLFAQEHLAKHISRGFGDNCVFQVFGTDTQNPKKETLDTFLDTVVQNLKENDRLNLQSSNVNISFDYEYPTQLRSFQKIKNNEFEVMKLAIENQFEVLL